MSRILTVTLILLALALTASAEPKRKTSSKSKPKTSKKATKKKKAVSKAPVVITEHYDGIDVSSHQKEIDWDKVAADTAIRFVYIKATEGATYVSPHYSRNVAEARRLGLKVGSYHFLRTTSSMSSQFENFKRTVKPEDQDLLPVIDFESRGNWTPKQIADSIEAFAAMMREYYNCEAMIYTSSNFYNKYLSPHFDGYPLFIARYHADAPRLAGGASYTLWQFTENAKVDGIAVAVDMSRFAEGKDIADISIVHPPEQIVPESVATVEYNDADTAAAQAPAPALSKEELKRLEKERKKAEKERKKEEKRLKKELEKARKDSIKMERRRAKLAADSIAALRSSQQETEGKSQSSQAAERGSTYSSQYPTRRGGE